MRHFQARDYYEKNGKFTLEKNAIPSVFVHFSNDLVEIISGEIIDEIEAQSKTCPQCPCLLEKIENLKYEMLLMKTKHDALVTRLEEKITESRKSSSEKSKQLNKLKNDKSKLQLILDEMRSQNYISDSDRQFLNVNINFSTGNFMFFSVLIHYKKIHNMF